MRSGRIALHKSTLTCGGAPTAQPPLSDRSEARDLPSSAPSERIRRVKSVPWLLYLGSLAAISGAEFRLIFGRPSPSQLADEFIRQNEGGRDIGPQRAQFGK